MKVNLDDTIMQSKTMTQVCNLLDEITVELKRLSRKNAEPNENTKDLISLGRYVSNVNKKRLDVIKKYKKA
tara:strand:- start:1319 stop:1531 length:213 start_codon:yes stop_codon:yes gene_type:complete